MKVALVCCPIWCCGSPPLSVATLQAFLKQNEYEVIPFDFNIKFYRSYGIRYRIFKLLFDHYPEAHDKLFYASNLINKKIYDSYVGEIINSGADVVCFTTYKSNGLASAYIANMIKRVDSKKKIIFGGPFCFNKTPRERLVKSGNIDVIIVGEGENLLLKQLEQIKKRRFKEKCVINSATERDFLDINKEPVPDFEGLPLNMYTTDHLPYAHSRGCINKCAHCFESIFWKTYRAKSAKKIFKDIRQLRDKYKKRSFFFTDSLINGNKYELEKLCDMIITNNLNIRWYANAICKNLNNKLLKKMEKSGCRLLIYGIESGSQRILDVMKKGDIKEIEKIIKMTYRAKIKVLVNIMTGYPTETWSDFYKTIKFLYKHKKNLSLVRVHPTFILKSSELYNSARSYNITKKDSIFWFSKNNNFLIRLMKLIILNGMVKILIKNKSQTNEFLLSMRI